MAGIVFRSSNSILLMPKSIATLVCGQSDDQRRVQDKDEVRDRLPLSIW